MSTPKSSVPPTPKRGRGQPRFVDTRITIGLPGDLLADIDAAAQAAGTTRAQEIRRRLARR